MKYLFIYIIVCAPLYCLSQQVDSVLHKVNAFTEKSLGKIEKNITALTDKIEKKALKSLSKLQRQEAVLQKKLAAKDSIAAKQLSAVDKTYKSLAEKVKSVTDLKGLKEYIPGFDSLKTGFKFLGNANTLTSKFPKEWTDKIKNVNGSITELEGKLQQAADVQNFMKERKQQLKEQLEKYGMGKKLKKLNKEIYYYQQQLNEYKALLKDPKKLEQRAITELRKLPAFTEFMKKNSMLAQLFRLPDNYGTPGSLAGLQTRASVQNQVQARFAGSNVNPQLYVQQQMGAAKAELNKLKDKANKLGGGSSDLEIPDFKPNTQKTKSFFKRLEYGANVQSQKANGILPVTSDIALTGGYKLNDKSVIGIGAAYKLGWGSGIEHIRISHQGVGLRSYVDVKLKGSFWITGGYEQNYQHDFTKYDELKDISAWQTSGLIGLTKKYKIGKKTSNLQLLWDFMSYQQAPRRQALVFRVGYTF